METIVTTPERIEQAFVEWYKQANSLPDAFTFDISDPVEAGKASADFFRQAVENCTTMTSVFSTTTGPDLIITTPTQLLAAYVMLLKGIGFSEEEQTMLAALWVDALINNLKELNGQS